MTEQEIERTLKWYCLDCRCNDNCKDHKCAFYSFFKQYLEGDEKALPPKGEWCEHSTFHRFHRQLVHNLEEQLYKIELPDNSWAQGYNDGMKKMIEMVKTEIRYLSKS